MLDPSKRLEKLEKELDGLEKNLRSRSRLHILKIAKMYIAHIGDYAAASVGKRERELDDRYKGLFLDFRQEKREGRSLR